jgi:hypothetical protein
MNVITHGLILRSVVGYFFASQNPREFIRPRRTHCTLASVDPLLPLVSGRFAALRNLENFALAEDATRDSLEPLDPHLG